jgi:predicted transcriptional regulator
MFKRMLLSRHSHMNLYLASACGIRRPGVSRLTRRSRLETIAEILETAKDGAKKTSVMYRCNLSYRQTKELLDYLLEIRLVTMGKSYHTTEKGRQFLEAYHTLEFLLEPNN